MKGSIVFNGAQGGRSFFDFPYLLLSLTALFWAINIVLGRFIAGTVPPVALAQIRWTGAALIIAIYAWPHLRRDWAVIRRSLPILVILGLTGVTLYNTMAYVGLNYTQAINGLLMQSTGPLLVGLWSLILFRDPLTRQQLAGIILSLIGVVLIIAKGTLAILDTLALNVGDLWFLGALVIYALYTVLLRKRPPIHFLSLLATTIILGAILLVPATILEAGDGVPVSLTPVSLAVMVYVMVFPSILGYVFFNRGVELIGANRAGQFFHLIPVFGSIIAILFLGERPEWYHGVGYALILAGIVVAQRNATRMKGPDRNPARQ